MSFIYRKTLAYQLCIKMLNQGTHNPTQLFGNLLQHNHTLKLDDHTIRSIIHYAKCR